MNEGLRISRFAVPILSKASAHRHWPQRELCAFTNEEVASGMVRVLPLIAGSDHSAPSTKTAAVSAARLGIRFLQPAKMIPKRLTPASRASVEYVVGHVMGPDATESVTVVSTNTA